MVNEELLAKRQTEIRLVEFHFYFGKAARPRTNIWSCNVPTLHTFLYCKAGPLPIQPAYFLYLQTASLGSLAYALLFTAESTSSSSLPPGHL